MLAHVSSRLGFKYPLDKAQVKTIWDMCRYDVAWNLDRASAWCIVSIPVQIHVNMVYNS